MIGDRAEAVAAAAVRDEVSLCSFFFFFALMPRKKYRGYHRRLFIIAFPCLVIAYHLEHLALNL